MAMLGLDGIGDKEDGWLGVCVVVEAGRGWRAEAGDRVLSAVPLLAFDI
jgi:hypothetical protein